MRNEARTNQNHQAKKKKRENEIDGQGSSHPAERSCSPKWSITRSSSWKANGVASCGRRDERRKQKTDKRVSIVSELEDRKSATFLVNWTNGKQQQQKRQKQRKQQAAVAGSSSSSGQQVAAVAGPQVAAVGSNSGLQQQQQQQEQ